ncbi:MAG TPA: AAA family ATPase [Alphaproteobacteria bacterium]|nr:AAA family ATPase [Alphaproteobacteria bacterium]
MSLALKPQARQLNTGSALRFAACVADDITQETIARMIARNGWTGAKLQAGGIEAARRLLQAKPAPTLLLVDIGDDSGAVEALAELIAQAPAGTGILAVGAVNDIAFYRRVMALCLVDYLVKPIAPEALQAAIAVALEPPAAEVAAAHKPGVVTVLGARGGVGATGIAASIGWCLAEQYRQRTALLDLDLQLGNLAMSLDLEPGRGLRETLENPERIDSLLVASAMAQATERLKVLAAEEPLAESMLVEGAAVSSLLGVLRLDFDGIVVDLPRRLDRAARQVLSQSDAVVVVTDLSICGMRDTLRLNELLDGLDLQARRLLVANQAGANWRGEVGRRDFEATLKRPLDFVVPFDAKAAVAAAHAARPFPAVAAGSKATAEIAGIVQALAGAAPRAGRAFWKRWF